VETPNSLLLRTRFDSALVLLKPLLSDSDALSGTSLYRAMSQLHKTYPDLRGDEIEALVSEVIRSLQNRGGKH
jgi:CRISPR/Cas system CSM-associated protein Csm4 (group 5 of RAMP superfamily)